MSTTRTQILTEVQFTEIIQVTTLETRLKKNFQLIVDELRRQSDNSNKKDGEVKQLRELITSLQEKYKELATSQQTAAAKDQASKSSVKDLLKEVAQRDSSIKHDIQQMIDSNNEKNSQERNKNKATVDQMKSEIEALKAKMQLHNKFNVARDDSLDTITKEIDNLKEEMARQREELEKLQQTQESSVAAVAAVTSQSSLQRAGDSDKDLRQTLTTLPSSASNDDLSQRLAALEQLLNELSEHVREKDKVIQTHTKEIWDLNEKTFNLQRSNDIDHIKMKEEIEAIKRALEASGIKIGENGTHGSMLRPKSGMNDQQKRIKDLQRKIQLLLQNNELLSKNLKGCEDEIETLVSQLNTSSRNMTSILQNQTTDRQADSKQYDKDAKNDLKRELLLKINDQRREYMTLLKGINNNKNSQNHEEQDREFQDAINELKYNMGKKADEENTKKAVVFLEKKINYIFNTFLNVGEEDARIAKKNWFCLSCDRKLNTFTGKIGDFIPSPGMKGAKLNSTISLEKLMNTQPPALAQTANQRYKSRSKLDLPSLQPTTAKRN